MCCISGGILVFSTWLYYKQSKSKKKQQVQQYIKYTCDALNRWQYVCLDQNKFYTICYNDTIKPSETFFVCLFWKYMFLTTLPRIIMTGCLNSDAVSLQQMSHCHLFTSLRNCFAYCDWFIPHILFILCLIINLSLPIHIPKILISQ